MEPVDPRRRDETRVIGEQAAEWLLLLEDGDEPTRERFGAWIAESPLHVEAFLRASAMDSLLGETDPHRAISIEDMSGHEPSAVAPLTPAPSVPSGIDRSGARARVRGPFLLAACVAVFAVTAILAWHDSMRGAQAWTQYVTDIGEQRAVEMDDGSLLHMNTASRVKARFLADERTVRLLEGEAMFRVHPDPHRPFRVYSGRSVIQALGTVFNIKQDGKGAVVSVLEGLVRVDDGGQSLRLDAGQQARIETTGGLTLLARPDIARAGAWRQRRLIFVDEPLSSIAAEFNRYNRAPKIVVEDALAGERRYAAAFDADDPESLLTVLERDPRLRVKQSATELLIRSR